ncbi:hypothetical protein G7Y79_00012g033060 [Physcia stellaris]|nr:hypothetical protein G7Y79_00012g033060 [Physcia stellaris]
MPQPQPPAKRTIPEHGVARNTSNAREAASFDAYLAARLTTGELEALACYFQGIPLASAKFWEMLSQRFSWETYAIDPRFWDSIKRLAMARNKIPRRSERDGGELVQLPVDESLRELNLMLVAQASGMLGLSEASWGLRSWTNLYAEPPSTTLGENWRDILAEKLHAEQKRPRKKVSFLE